jgi:hypothetical protein
MPIVARHPHQRLIAEVSARFDDLDRLLALRDLRSPTEGARERAPWPEAEKLAVTFGSEEQIRIAVDTLKAVLAEVKKTKSLHAPRVFIHPRFAPKALPPAKPILKP